MLGNIMYTGVAIIGVLLMLTGLAGAALNGMPLLQLIPFIGTNIAWIAANSAILIGSGVFLTGIGFTRSLVSSLILTIVVMVALYFVGVVKI